MDIASDVRYSVLKEKASEADSSWTTDIPLDDEATVKSRRSSKASHLNKTKQSSIDELELANQQQLTTNINKNSDITINQSKADENIKINFQTLKELANEPMTIVNDHQQQQQHQQLDLEQNIPRLEFSHSAMSTEKCRTSKRSVLERFLFIVIIALFLVIILMYFFILNKINPQNKILPNGCNKNNTYCNTDRCIVVSGSIYRSLNTKVDPCDDFYEFSCGGWIKKI